MTLKEKATKLRESLQGDLNVFCVGVGDTGGKDDFLAIYLHGKARPRQYPNTFLDVRVEVREDAAPAPIGGVS